MNNLNWFSVCPPVYFSLCLLLFCIGAESELTPGSWVQYVNKGLNCSDSDMIGVFLKAIYIKNDFYAILLSKYLKSEVIVTKHNFIVWARCGKRRHRKL
jgi:hypothetical protein